MPYGKKKSGFKMYGKSPMTKKLVGNQHRLPEALKAEIRKAPETPYKKYKSDAQRKAVHASKAEQSAMKKKGCSSAYKMMDDKKKKDKKKDTSKGFMGASNYPGGAKNPFVDEMKYKNKKMKSNKPCPGCKTICPSCRK